MTAKTYPQQAVQVTGRAQHHTPLSPQAKAAQTPESPEITSRRRAELIDALRTVQEALYLGVAGVTIGPYTRTLLAMHAATLVHGLQTGTASDAEQYAEEFLNEVHRIKP